jgi:hypothetical protein
MAGRNPFFELLSVGEEVIVSGDIFTEEEGKFDRMGVITALDLGSIRREYGYRVKVQGINGGNPFAVHCTEAVRLDEKIPVRLGLVYKK